MTHEGSMSRQKAAELAARMTGVRPVDPRDVYGDGTPGLGITALDVAGALAMGDASPLAEAVVRLKYVGDTSVQSRAFYLLYDRAMTLATREKWKLPVGGDLVRKMTQLALLEAVSSQTCKACEGRGQAPRKDSPVMDECPVCHGVGRRGKSQAERARQLGVDRTTFTRIWSPRYERVLRMVLAEEAEGLRAIDRGLGD